MLTNTFLYNESVLKIRFLKYSLQPAFSAQEFLYFMYFSDSRKFSYHISEKKIMSGPLEKERTTKVDTR